MLGISSVAVFKRIKSGKIKAEKIGRNYVIPHSEILDLGIIVQEEQENKPASIPEIKAFEYTIEQKPKNTVLVHGGKTFVATHHDLFTTRIDISGQDLLVGFNEPAFKKSHDDLETADLDSPLNARLITYFLPAVQIAKMQKTRPRLVIVSGINASFRYNAENEIQKKILYRNNSLKMKFIVETLEKFFPNTFSIIETRLAYDFMKVSEDKLDQLWHIFIKRYPERMKPLAESLARFSMRGDENLTDEKKLKEAFHYAVIHLFACGDINLDYDFIHAHEGYCSVGEHQELIFNIVREVGYEILKDIGDIVFDREVRCYKNAKIVIQSEGHVPPSYNGAFRSNHNKTKLDEVTYENKYPLSYYEERPRLKPHMEYLYKIIPRDVYEKYWNDYQPRYRELKARFNEAYQIED